MIRRFLSHRWAGRIFIGVCLVVGVAQAAVTTSRREQHIGDYDVNREMGRRFLAHEHLYAGGLNYTYTPTAALWFAPLALVPPGIGFTLRYAAAVAGLWLTLRLLCSMVGRTRRLSVAPVWPVEIFTLVLGAQYIIRDLDDGGPHLLLLTVLVGGAYCAFRGRDVLGATWFGLATVLKAPAGLFLPFLLWKRQWKLAGLSAVAVVLWTMLPMAWMGPASWWSHQVEWTRTVFPSVLGSPAISVQDNEQRVQNQSLRLAVMRYLVTYPDDHPMRLSHPAYVSVLALPPDTARWLAAGIVGAVLLVSAWLMRGRYRSRDDPAWLLECSAVLILALLLSPITWTQHLVLITPALYLIATEWWSRSLGTAASAAIWAFTLPALLLNREFVGKDLSLLFLSYHMHTLGLLLILAVTLLRRGAGLAPMRLS